MYLKRIKDSKLFELYADLMKEMMDRKLIRSANNPVGDIRESITVKRLKLKLVTNSNKGFDAIGKDGIRYQIKCRRITDHNKSRQLSVIRNLNKNLFDYLIAVMFDKNFRVKEFYKIPRDIIKKYASYSEYQHGHILTLTGSILASPGVVKYG